MNQAQLQALAEERILDAMALLSGGRWSFAYYVAGYAVECALKSCLLSRMVHTGWIFKDKVRIDECRTHDFAQLIVLAELTDALNGKLATSRDFVKNWGTAGSWRVESRYETKTEPEARLLYAAITDEPEGVLRWIRGFW